MTIRTKEELKKLGTNIDNVFYSNYLPIALAYCLPRLYNIFNTDTEHISIDRFCNIVNNFLKNPEMTVIGFGRKLKVSEHFCCIEYCDNLRTFGEARNGINGLPSIGIRFVDPDDNWNDYVWISLDSMKKYEYGDEITKEPYKSYIDFIDKYYE